MISIYQIKPAFQRLLMPVMHFLRKMGVTPNGLTVVSVLASVGLGAAFYMDPTVEYLWIIPVFLLLRMALNALDGMMAVAYDMRSRLGEVLNEMGDVVSDAGLYLSLIALPGLEALSVAVFVWMAATNEMAGVLAKALSGKRQYDGPMGKSDRALLIGLSLLISFFWRPLLNQLDVILWVGSVLMVVSTYIRLKRCLKTGV